MAREWGSVRTVRHVTARRYAAGGGEFKLHATRTNLEAVREEVLREREKEFRVPPFKAKPVPEYPSEVTRVAGSGGWGVTPCPVRRVRW